MIFLSPHHGTNLTKHGWYYQTSDYLIKFGLHAVIRLLTSAKRNLKSKLKHLNLSISSDFTLANSIAINVCTFRINRYNEITDHC